MMTRARLVALATLILAGCQGGDPSPPSTPPSAVAPAPARSLAEAREGFRTKLVHEPAAREPVAEPPADLFRVVSYDAPAGKLAAYLGRAPADGRKHPAIVWCFGGSSNGIGETAWEDAPPDNDQSASAFRKAGIVMMYPSLRGGNENPGAKEGFLGEVDDVLAAADFLARQDQVDPARIYLGGHSTGGTLALLVAETSPRFRGVFALGPAAYVAGYGPDALPFDASNAKELELRSPILWLGSARGPTFVFEGTEEPTNLASLDAMTRVSGNPALHFHPVKGLTHFSLIAPLTRLIAAKIVADEPPGGTIRFAADELARLATP